MSALRRAIPRPLAALGARARLCSGSSSTDNASHRAATRATEFGYRTVQPEDKEQLVGNVFHSVASSYDIMNDLMSAGLHRVWKDAMVNMIGLQSMGRRDLQVLDVAGGTGDIAFRIADQMGSLGPPPVGGEGELQPEEPRVVVMDINKSMLETGRKRSVADAAAHPTRPRMEWVHASAEQLPFDDCSFDVYTIAFGIRNVTNIEDALSEARRRPAAAAHSHSAASPFYRPYLYCLRSAGTHPRSLSLQPTLTRAYYRTLTALKRPRQQEAGPPPMEAQQCC